MNKTLHNILIGTTLSEGSDAVVQAGLALAAPSGATVHLVHACPPLAAFGPAPEPDLAPGGDKSPAGLEGWLAEEIASLQERLAAQGERTGVARFDGGRGGRGRIEVGMPYRVIDELSASLNADLIVLGATEPEHRHPLGLGSTADRVIRKVSCPVLLVRAGSPFPPHRILVPVDFSLGSSASLRYGLRLLGDLGGKPPATEVLFVLSPGESSVHFSSDQLARLAVDELQRFVHKHMPHQSATVTRRVRAGQTAEQILAEIDERRPDLVILGPQGRSGLEKMLIGSVADKVLRQSPCSILVVPPEVARREALETAHKGESADWSFVSDEMTLGASVH
jgi:nucleotide-binding universal stress UspA family protein